jgi:ferric-chelate reductase
LRVVVVAAVLLFIMATRSIFARQHIQDHAAATNVVYHWGYASRVVPCANDAGSCAYLDAVYWMHDVSMLYTFIMWAVIGGLLGIFVFLRIIKPSSCQQPSLVDGSEQQSAYAESSFYRAWRGILAFFRRRLLPEGFTKIFGRVTRLQVLILAIICGYLTIFT